jgi:hypothetical protein
MSSAECDEHVEAVDKRRAKLLDDRRHEEVRRQREVLRDELDGRRVAEWQVQQHAMRKIMPTGSGRRRTSEAHRSSVGDDSRADLPVDHSGARAAALAAVDFRVDSLRIYHPVAH